MTKKKKEVEEKKVKTTEENPTNDSILGVKKLTDHNTELISDCVDILKFHRDRLDTIEIQLKKVKDRLGL
tara:strand:- start:273 stop:482 length:210 start_codon:yes stop_codon:yes gene_type:complete